MLEQHAGDGRRQNLPAPSIQFVAPEGMPDMRHMHTDLVRAARENPYPKQAVACPLYQHAPLAAGFLPVFTTATLTFTVGCLPSGASTVPAGAGDALHHARYSFRISRAANASESRILASSVSATQISPEVSLSRRCTMPGRKPSCARRDGKRATSRWTSVPSGSSARGVRSYPPVC